jgi:hypothetical protein
VPCVSNYHKLNPAAPTYPFTFTLFRVMNTATRYNTAFLHDTCTVDVVRCMLLLKLIVIIYKSVRRSLSTNELLSA